MIFCSKCCCLKYIHIIILHLNENIMFASARRKLKETRNTPIILFRIHFPLQNQYHNPLPPPIQLNDRYLLVVAYNIFRHESGVMWLSKPGLITGFTAFQQQGNSLLIYQLSAQWFISHCASSSVRTMAADQSGSVCIPISTHFILRHPDYRAPSLIVTCFSCCCV